jgi:Cupredoxin-like domain
MKNATSLLQQHRLRLVVIVVLLAIAVVGVYRYANTGNSQAEAAPGGPAQAGSNATPTGGTPAGATSTSSGGAALARGGCCGGGGSSTPVEGTAQITSSVQKISVDLSSGSYNPNVLKLKVGVPAEITFGQSSGCTGYVQSADLGFEADLTTGPQTVKLPALEPGTYGFACGMGMVTGQIVVE